MTEDSFSASLLSRIQQVYAAFQESPSTPPLWIAFSEKNTSPADDVGATLQTDKSYFEVRINELYLPYDRQWFRTRVPTVLAIPEFAYGDEWTATPAVVGPGLIQRTARELPLGMVFADTRVAGPIPYRGNGLTMAVVLYSMPRDNYLLSLIDTLTGLASVVDLSAGLSSYTKIANFVIGQVKQLGGNALSPIVGYRTQFHPVHTGFFAVVNQSERAFDPAEFQVVDGRLCHGPSSDAAKPFQEAEYVLFSVVPAKREHLQGLPLYKRYRDVLADANRAKNSESWMATKVKLSDLIWDIHASPDLTDAHKQELKKEWTDAVVAMKDEAQRRSTLGQTPDDLMRQQPIRDMLSILNL